MEANNTFARPAGVPTAPPPPPEVKVRTMKSDLAAMARSGGGLPNFETVQVIPSAISPTSGGGNAGKKKTVMVLIIAASVVALVLIGYVVYLFLKK